MEINFVDLKKQYLSIKDEVDNAIQSVISETAFIKGKYVEEFEKNFAKMYGVSNVIGVANGTDAIYIVLKSLGIGKGDEVITVANSWISTSETISQTGAMPIFIDIEKDYYNIDVNLIEKKITKRTKAIIPVHLYGQPCNIEKVVRLAGKYSLFVIEDCAQAHFAKLNNKYVGTFGNAATFSFYPGKNLGAYGDAGAIITNDNTLADRMRMFANHGALKKHQHEIEGINSRLDGLQAAILNVKLNYILDWNKKRHGKALTYIKFLENEENISLPLIRKNSEHIFHVFCIRVKNRNELKKYLSDNGIQTQIHYPVPLPLLHAYKHLNVSKFEIPIASEYMDEILSLPIYPELEEVEIEFISNKILEFYKQSKDKT